MQLLVLLGTIEALKIADWLGWIPEALKFLPLVGLSWAYFLIALVALALVVREGNGLSTVGLGRPARISTTIPRAVATLAALLAVGAIVDPIAVAMFGDAGDIGTFASVRGNLSLFVYLLPFVWVFAAFGEEAMYRGFVMTRLRQLLGSSRTAIGTALVLQAAAFGLAHLYQGPGGILSTGASGLVYGGAVLLCGGNLWVAILAHGLIDTIGFAALYAGLLPVPAEP